MTHGKKVKTLDLDSYLDWAIGEDITVQAGDLVMALLSDRLKLSQRDVVYAIWGELAFWVDGGVKGGVE